MGNFCFALGFFPKLTGRKEKDTYWKGSAKGSPDESSVYCLPRGMAVANSIATAFCLTEELWHLQVLCSLNDITLGFKKQDAWAKRIQKQQVALAPSPETDGCLQPGLQTEQGWVPELLRAWQHLGTQGEQGKN